MTKENYPSLILKRKQVKKNEFLNSQFFKKIPKKKDQFRQALLFSIWKSDNNNNDNNNNNNNYNNNNNNNNNKVGPGDLCL